MNRPHNPEDAERIINDFLNDIEKCKKYLDIIKEKPETEIKQLWKLNEALKKAVEATDKLKKKPYKVVKDFTDALIKVVLDLIEKGFELPIYMVAISHHSGSVMASRFEWDSKKESSKIRIVLIQFFLSLPELMLKLAVIPAMPGRLQDYWLLLATT